MMSVQHEEYQAIKEQIAKNQKIIDELNTQLARKTQQVRIIQEISSEVNTTLELEHILNTILLSMDNIFGFHHSMILLLDGSGEVLRVAASHGYETSGIGAEVVVGQGMIGVVAKRKKMMRMGNIGSQIAYLSAVKMRMAEAGQPQRLDDAVQLPGLADIQSQVAIPLLLQDQLLGVFAVESAQPNAFDELDELLLTIVANQVASAMNNARLYEAEKARREELDRAYATLSQLNEELEEKVQERTAELSHTLEKLQEETQRSAALLQRMAPPQVIPLMLEEKLIPQKLTSSVLFTDLEGFTSFSSDMDPDEVFSRLNHFFSRAGETIQRYRGYVNKTHGDAIMALFGVPFESATHAIDAVLAAWDLQREFHQHFALNMRVGISSGVITAGMLGPQGRSVYDVLGDTVNVASRMEKLCPPGGIAISLDTFKLVERYFEIDTPEEKEVKGKGTLPCFTVLGVRKLSNDRSRIDATSVFYNNYVTVVDEVEAFKQQHFKAINFLSIQARDGAINHNEAVACFAVALLRFLKTEALSDLGELRSSLDGLSEENVLRLALLHDLGKYAVDPEQLNDAKLSPEKRDRLRKAMFDQTSAAFKRLRLDHLLPSLEQLYRFEQVRDAEAETDLLTQLIAVGDIYDALTAPKVYKGRPWSIRGALEELLRIPHYQRYQCPVFRGFVDLLRPKDSIIEAQVRDEELFQ
jgi:adenylate cyclase